MGSLERPIRRAHSVVRTETVRNAWMNGVRSPMANLISADIMNFAVLQVPMPLSPVGTSFLTGSARAVSTHERDRHGSFGSYATAFAVGSVSTAPRTGRSPAASKFRETAEDGARKPAAPP